MVNGKRGLWVRGGGRVGDLSTICRPSAGCPHGLVNQESMLAIIVEQTARRFRLLTDDVSMLERGGRRIGETSAEFGRKHFQ